MLRLDEIQSEHSADLDDVNNWCSETYQSNFGIHFDGVRDLFSRLKSSEKSITDKELEWVLSSLPLELFAVSEKLNQFRMNLEVIKLKISEKSSALMSELKELDMSAAEKREVVADYVSEDKLLLNAFNVVVTRVENEISFSRELIMGVKKIWDGRRKGESVMPISEPSIPGADLPDYSSINTDI